MHRLLILQYLPMAQTSQKAAPHWTQTHWIFPTRVRDRDPYHKVSTFLYCLLPLTGACNRAPNHSKGFNKDLFQQLTKLTPPHCVPPHLVLLQLQTSCIINKYLHDSLYSNIDSPTYIIQKIILITFKIVSLVSSINALPGCSCLCFSSWLRAIGTSFCCTCPYLPPECWNHRCVPLPVCSVHWRVYRHSN